MRPGQQPPGGEPNPQHQSPYQQPGEPQWGAPTGAPQPPSGGGGGNRTRFVAIGAATAVVVAAGVTGFLLLGGNKDAKASAGSSPSATASASESDDSARGTETEKPTVPGWKVVLNPKSGVAFDVPAGWEAKGPNSAVAFTDEKTGKPIAYMGGIATGPRVSTRRPGPL